MSSPTGGNRHRPTPVHPRFFDERRPPTDLTSGKRSTRNPSLPPPYNTNRFARVLHSPPDCSNTPKAGNTVLKLKVSYILCGRSGTLMRTYRIITNTGGGRSILDCDPTTGCDPVTFQPCSDRAMANLKKYVDSIRRVYLLNKGALATILSQLGDIPRMFILAEIQPWYLATPTVAEQLYHALLTWDTLRAIDVTPISPAFFAQFVPGITPGTNRAGSESDSTSTTYSRLSAAIHAYANGGLAEQLDKASGAPASAANLSWSYAAVLTAFRARKGGPVALGVLGFGSHLLSGQAIGTKLFEAQSRKKAGLG